MKVGLVSDSLSSTAGGIFEIERSLALRLHHLGVLVTAWGVNDHRWEADRTQWQDIECRVRNCLGPRIFGYVPGLVKDLVSADCDLLHLQHLWMYPSVAVAEWHRRTRKPFLVTANGMLEPWTLSRSRLNKRLAALLYENRMLHRAACLQANTEKEVADFRAYGLRNPVCLIPNGVDLPTIAPRTQESAGRKTLLFLGRLHPKKGLMNALKAWAQVSGIAKNWQLVIAGWDQVGHGEELKRLCKELDLSYTDVQPPIDFASLWTLRLPVPGTHLDSLDCPSPHLSVAPIANCQTPTVVFTGPVFGDAKDALLRRADAFILPSFSEGLPMAVLEAWAYGLPVLMTDHCNLPEGFSEGAALRIGTDTTSITTGIRELFLGTCQDLDSMGAKGRALVEDRFTWPKVAAQMKEVYEWMLGEAGKPGCVL